MTGNTFVVDILKFWCLIKYPHYNSDNVDRHSYSIIHVRHQGYPIFKYNEKLSLDQNAKIHFLIFIYTWFFKEDPKQSQILNTTIFFSVFMS